MERGYVKLWRKSYESVVFEDERLWKLWCLCLMRAGHKKKTLLMSDTYIGIKLLPGQFLTGRFDLFDMYYPSKQKKGEIRVKPQTIWRWLQALQKMKKLTITPLSKGSVITINNWEQYQVENQTEEWAMNNSQTPEPVGFADDSEGTMNNSCTTVEQQLNNSKSPAGKGFPEGQSPENGGFVNTTKKEELTTTTKKKIIKEKVSDQNPPRKKPAKKAEKNIDLTKCEIDDVDRTKIDARISPEVIEQFILHRKVKKSPLTQFALELTCKTATKCSDGFGITPDEAILYGIERGWLSINYKWMEKDFGKEGAVTGPRVAPQRMTARQQYMHELGKAIEKLEGDADEQASNDTTDNPAGSTEIVVKTPGSLP